MVLMVSHGTHHTSRSQYAPKLLGHTRAAMVGTMGPNLDRGRQSSNPTPVVIEG
jgi:hypothetical protein